MSDTPRTDAAEFTADWQIDCSFRMQRGQVVRAEFAQELERELAKTERLRFGADATRRQQRCELDALRAENERLKDENELDFPLRMRQPMQRPGAVDNGMARD